MLAMQAAGGLGGGKKVGDADTGRARGPSPRPAPDAAPGRRTIREAEALLWVRVSAGARA